MNRSTLEVIMSEAGSTDRAFEHQLLSHATFAGKFKQLKTASRILSDWSHSHIDMHDFAEAFHNEQIRLGISTLHAEAVAIAKGILTNAELRQFDLASTENLAHLPIREVFAKLENGEVPSISAAA